MSPSAPDDVCDLFLLCTHLKVPVSQGCGVVAGGSIFQSCGPQGL